MSSLSGLSSIHKNQNMLPSGTLIPHVQRTGLPTYFLGQWALIIGFKTTFSWKLKNWKFKTSIVSIGHNQNWNEALVFETAESQQ